MKKEIINKVINLILFIPTLSFFVLISDTTTNNIVGFGKGLIIFYIVVFLANFVNIIWSIILWIKVDNRPSWNAWCYKGILGKIKLILGLIAISIIFYLNLIR